MIFTEDMDRVIKDINLEPGERLFVSNDDGDKIEVGLTNNGEIVIHGASEFTSEIQVLPRAANCIYLQTRRTK